MELSKRKYFLHLLLLITLIAFSSINSHAREESTIREYTVEKNDTLMLIAFRIYGDYRRWKDLLKLNPELSKANHDLENVTTIKYEVPRESFKWQPLGEPYLIKRRDTLGIISYNVYNTHKKWRKIYDNNRPLIRDPNLIFAGFTLYYIPEKKFENIARKTATVEKD